MGMFKSRGIASREERTANGWEKETEQYNMV